MMWLAFFFLLRPGEYTSTARDSHPFLIRDVSLWEGERPMSYRTTTSTELQDVTFLSLTFVTQKNDHKGEVVGHG